MKITIIGAGPGGYETAVAAAKRGIEVNIIYNGYLGGTCLNEGCIPTKTLCKHATLLEDLHKADVFGIDNISFNINYAQIQQRKEGVIASLRDGIAFLLNHKNITLIKGQAVLKDTHTVVVEGKEYVSDYIIIATGSVSATLPIPGNNLDGVITSKEILEMEDIPNRLCVIGAGVIGLEFASIFNSFGSKVNVVEYCKDILPRFDTDLAKRLKQSLGKKGIQIETSAQVQSIEKVEGGLKIVYTKKNKQESIEADKVLMAVGRKPNIDSLNLDHIGIAYSKKGIEVDDNMRTNIPNIYAIGDIVGGLMLAHVATFQGLKALSAILTDNGLDTDIDANKINLSIVPAAVFTSPEAACVGKTEEDCKAEGIEFKCLKSFYRSNGKAVSMDEPDGLCKVIVAVGNTSTYKKGQILGCHLFGAHASDIIHEVVVAMNACVTIEDFKHIVHAHPTLAEVILSAFAE